MVKLPHGLVIRAADFPPQDWELDAADCEAPPQGKEAPPPAPPVELKQRGPYNPFQGPKPPARPKSSNPFEPSLSGAAPAEKTPEDDIRACLDLYNRASANQPGMRVISFIAQWRHKELPKPWPVSFKHKPTSIDTIMSDIAGRSVASHTYFHPAQIDPKFDGKKASDEDIMGRLSLILDSDVDHSWTVTPIDGIKPSMLVQTSQVNQQIHYVFSRMLPGDEFRALATLAYRKCGGDPCCKVPSCLFRMPGTPNHPDHTKLARGRDPEPYTARIISGSLKLIDPDVLRQALERMPDIMPPAPDVTEANGDCDVEAREGTAEEIAAIVAKIPEFTQALMRKPTGEDGERSDHCFRVMLQLLEWGLTPDEVFLISNGAAFSEKFWSRRNGDDQLIKEIKRAYQQWVAKGSYDATKPPPTIGKRRLAEGEGGGEPGGQAGDADEEKTSFDAQSFFGFVGRPSVNDVDGLLAELRDFILHHSPIYQNKAMALGSAISIISALAGRTLASPTVCSLNLYIAMLAPTGGGKDFPLKAPGKVFNALDARGIIAGSFASAAAIEERLNITPTVLAAIDEFGNQLLARFTGNRASTHELALGGVIRQLWSIRFDTYNGTSAVVRGGAKVIDSPHLVLLGAATHNEFYEALGSGNVSNGLLNRLLIIDAPSSVDREDDAPFRVCFPDDLLERLREILPDGDTACLLSPTQPEFTVIPWAADGAEEAWKGFRREINRRTALAPEIEPFVKRTAEQAIRLASLHAIGCNGRNAKVTLKDVKWGIAFSAASSQVMIEGAQQYIAENEAQKKTRIVQSALIEIWKKKKGKEPVATRSQLYRKIDGKITARDIDGIAAALEEAGFLTIVISEPSKKGGRKSTSYVKGGAL